MAPPLLFDVSTVDFDRVLFDAPAIEAVNPHRGAMRMIDAVVHDEPEHIRIVAYKDVRDDEFWVPGHIPGRPVFPGVLMIEAAAQCASFVSMRRFPDMDFMGFVGVEGVKFRGQVRPGDRFVILCQGTELRPRRCVCQTQGLVNGNLVYEGRITGMPI